MTARMTQIDFAAQKGQHLFKQTHIYIYIYIYYIHIDS